MAAQRGRGFALSPQLGCSVKLMSLNDVAAIWIDDVECFHKCCFVMMLELWAVSPVIMDFHVVVMILLGIPLIAWKEETGWRHGPPGWSCSCRSYLNMSLRHPWMMTSPTRRQLYLLVYKACVFSLFVSVFFFHPITKRLILFPVPLVVPEAQVKSSSLGICSVQQQRENSRQERRHWSF